MLSKGGDLLRLEKILRIMSYKESSQTAEYIADIEFGYLAELFNDCNMVCSAEFLTI